MTLLQNATLFQNVADVALFKEHIFVCKHYDCSGDYYNKGFYALCCLGHGNFFLHKVYEQVEDNTCKYASAVFYVNPGGNKAHWCYRNQKVYHVKKIHLPDFVVISSRNPEERDMPGSPDKAKNNRLLKPGMVLSN